VKIILPTLGITKTNDAFLAQKTHFLGKKRPVLGKNAIFKNFSLIFTISYGNLHTNINF
jgi:hypothetical protein